MEDHRHFSGLLPYGPLYDSQGSLVSTICSLWLGLGLGLQSLGYVAFLKAPVLMPSVKDNEHGTWLVLNFIGFLRGSFD